ncbi:hypothetical protein [Robertmurraya sp.]|uniref:hypothetical protein n=1 Tax=Robertmurraya sp. TaxID=2837525 RepID=UPI0037043D04
MNLKLDGWNIGNKEEFVQYLIKEAHARFTAAKASGRMTDQQYWDALDDLRNMAKHYLDVDLREGR